MLNPYERRLTKLETPQRDQERFHDVGLRVMRAAIEMQSLGWLSPNDSEETKRAWEAITKSPLFPEMDAAVRRGERLHCGPTVPQERR